MNLRPSPPAGADAVSSPASFDDLYEDAPCGYVTHRASDGTILGMNRTLASWLGHPAASLVGVRRFQDLLTPPARLIHETRHIVALRLGGTVDAAALEIRRAGGERTPVLVSSKLRRGVDGEPVIWTTMFDGTAHRRYEGQLIDARDRAEAATADARRAREAAEAANWSKSRFIAAMNHEFRTPINAISGFSELLSDDGAELTDGQKRDFFALMRSAAAHLVGLLEDATRYVDLDRVERDANRSVRLRLRGLVADSLRVVGSALDGRSIRVELEASHEDPEVLTPDSAAEALAFVFRDIARSAPGGALLKVAVIEVPGGGAVRMQGPAVARLENALRASRLAPDSPEFMRRGLEGSGLGLAYAERVLGLAGGAIDPAGIDDEA
ncbi:MAG: histidine kinase dimerization/phospho-acceptor domain-containing protein, partial [Alphaproteobacteria bacterium]